MRYIPKRIVISIGAMADEIEVGKSLRKQDKRPKAEVQVKLKRM